MGFDVEQCAEFAVIGKPVVIPYEWHVPESSKGVAIRVAVSTPFPMVRDVPPKGGHCPILLPSGLKLDAQ